MQQEFFVSDTLKAPNISKVPHYSPFRYPGGKTWLYPFAKKWLLTHSNRFLVDPFVGGGYVSLIAGIEKLANEVLMVEIDSNVSSVWRTILNGDGEWLIEQILNLELTHENVDKIIANAEKSDKTKGFATLLTNRIVRGGILAPGSGRIKKGENGKGIKSRWYPETLARRINQIVAIKDRVNFKEGDAFDSINDHKSNKNALFFIDPPYPKAGKRLYTHHEIDHEYLFHLMAEVKGDFLMTYEDSENIMKLVNKHNFEFEKILMSTTHHRKKFELLISKDISWLKQ